jgi:hypothetical protein
MTDDAFARRFQAAATEVVRMYSTAFTVMEIEMGSGTALALAPHFLGDVVAAAERIAISELQAEAEAKALAEEEQAAAQRRRQLTIEDALAGAERPW